MKKLFLSAAVLIASASSAQATETVPFTKAAYVFGVEDIAHDGKNIITFTIPKNARSIDEQADAVVLSGLYDMKDEKPTGNCPIVSSYDVSKKVKNYDPFTGKADITATFDNEKDAKKAYDAGCLVIDDTEK